MTREEFLLDTIQYYSEDVSRRCVQGNKCTYSGKTLDKNSDGCAIGRWLPEEVKLDVDAIGDVPVTKEVVFEKLPDWMKEFGKSFLLDIQDLHDYNNLWNSSGLNDQGKSKVNYIITNYELNISKYE